MAEEFAFNTRLRFKGDIQSCDLSFATVEFANLIKKL